VPLPSIRLVRFAKLTVSVTIASTIFCTFLIVGWQITIFLRDGSWRALPLSLVFNTPEFKQGEVYLTASIDKTSESWTTNLTDAVLHMPIITILLLAVAVLTAFYSWILRVERELAKSQIE